MSTTNDNDVLDTLTPEERAAIEDTEYSQEELAAMKGIAAEGGEDDEDDDDGAGTGDGGDKTPVEGKGAADGAAAAGKKEETASDDDAGNDDSAGEAAQDDKRTPRAVYRASLPEDYDAQVKAVSDEMSALSQSFRAGEIEFEDFETRQAELLAKRDNLRDVKIKADISSEMNSQTVEQEWKDTVTTFVANVAKTEGIDYSKDTEKQADLDLFVKRLAENPANGEKPMTWFLAEAHKRVKALHGVADEAKPGNQEEKPKKQDRKPPTDAIPKTLAQVPGSDGPGDVGDEFADLDGLEGLELEDALRKMTPAQREKYAMAGA